MTEFVSGGNKQEAAVQPSYVAEIIRGLGLPVEQISAEDVGIPGRGMEDEDTAATGIPVNEHLYVRVKRIAKNTP